MKVGIFFIAILLTAGLCPAQATRSATRPTAVTVAIFDFDANVPGNPDLGKQAAEALSALMSGQSVFQLVDRAQLSKVLTEQELALTGLADQDKVKVGKLAGARLLVTGKIFTLDKSLFVTAKVIGTETTLVEGVLVKAKAGTDTGELLVELSEKLQKRITDAAPKLLGDDRIALDPMPALIERLAKKAKPTVTVQVTERHIGEAQRAPDPPVEAELRSLFIAAGFTVLDPAEAKAKADLVIKGEAFSEFATRVQNLRSCTGRAELHLVNLADGKVIATVRTTARAADLSENIAGRTALQRAGNDGAIQLLQKLAETLPDQK